jgi:ABC-type transport system involved in multi-copper enzyme maturation permease subunit
MRPRLGLPLLAKELIELAARPRTYSIRTLYAAGLFGVFAFMFYNDTARLAPSAHSLLGVGKQLLGYMFAAQLVGVYAFLPAMVSGCITEEKEKRTLELLFITDLTPAEIVIQKLVGRLVPMLTLLLLSLPLMAVCYTFGGLSADEVAMSAVVLVTTCVQVGAFSILMSAYSRTSSEALIGTYGYAILVAIAVWFVAGIATLVLGAFMFAARSETGLYIAAAPAVLAAGLTPFVAMDAAGMGWGGSTFSIGIIVAAWGWSAVFVWRARRYLVERAFLQPKRKKHSFFGGMVRYARRRAARRRQRGIDDTSYLPGDEPILWRETTGTYLDWPHGFRGALGFVMFPILYIGLAAALGKGPGGQCGWISFIIFVMWISGAVAVTVRSSRAFALERANRTLDVLLATPLAGSEIVRQKMKASWRVVLLFAAPLITLFLIEAWLEIGRFSARQMLEAAWYLAVATLSVFVLLPALAWVSFLVGMRLKDARRATLLALGVLIVWNAGPPLVAAFAEELVRGQSGWVVCLALLSPTTVLTLIERGSYDTLAGGNGPAVALAGLALNALVLRLVRRACLRNADRYLGRPAVRAPSVEAPAPRVPTAGGAA